MTLLQWVREDVDASGWVATSVRDLRKRGGLSAQRLAEECARQGMPQLNRGVIANIESRRRRQGITVDELIVFARALGVEPVDLLP